MTQASARSSTPFQAAPGRLAELQDQIRTYARLGLAGPKLLPNARYSPAKLMNERARNSPKSLALIYRDQRFSSSELAAGANRYAHFFASQGVGSGTVVSLLMDNRPDFVFAVLGLSQLGAVSSLVNTTLTGEGLRHVITTAQSRKILVGEEHLAKLEAISQELGPLAPDKDIYVKRDEELETREANSMGATMIDDELAAQPGGVPKSAASPRNSDVYCYIFTSGTTGLPKPAIIRNQRMLGANFMFGHLMHRCGEGDVIYVPLPLYHSSAMFAGLGAALVTGAAFALRRRFSAREFWRDVERYHATSFIYIGEVCRYLLNSEASARPPAHSLRVAVGNGMAPNLWQEFQQRFSIPIVREFYGSTEGNAFLINAAGKPGMVGRLAGNQILAACDSATGDLIRDARGRCRAVSIGESGLLLSRISSWLTFEGYLDKKATQKKILEGVLKPGDRYFNSGDLLTLHEGRWLSFSDRLGDTFRWKGENVSTCEVTELLLKAGGVEEANVFGVEVPGCEGRAGMAALSTKLGFDLEQFSDYVGANLAHFQRPLFLRQLQEKMEVTGTFKQQKTKYREQAFDLDSVRDPLFILQGGRYQPYDASLRAKLEQGELQL